MDFAISLDPFTPASILGTYEELSDRLADWNVTKRKALDELTSVESRLGELKMKSVEDNGYVHLIKDLGSSHSWMTFCFRQCIRLREAIDKLPLSKY